MLHYTITIHLVRYNIIVYYAILHHTLYCPVKFFKNRRLCVIIFLGTLAGRERERRGRGMERGRGKGDGGRTGLMHNTFGLRTNFTYTVGRPAKMYAACAFQVIAITWKAHAAYMWLGRLAHFKKLLALRPKPYLHLHAMGKQPSYIILTLCLQARRIFTYTVVASIFHRMEMWMQFWTGLSASDCLKSARRPAKMYAACAFQVITVTSKTHAAYMCLGRLWFALPCRGQEMMYTWCLQSGAALLDLLHTYSAKCFGKNNA